MYENGLLIRDEQGYLATPMVDYSAFQDFVLPPVQPRGDEAPNCNIANSRARLLSSRDEQSPDDGSKPTAKANDRHEFSGSPDWYGLHQGRQEFIPPMSNVPSIHCNSGKFNAEKPLPGERKQEVRNNPENAVDPRKELKTGAAAVKEYISDLPKLATAASGDIDTAFELMMVWKGTSVKAKEELAKDRSPFVSVLSTELVFSPSDPKDMSWELRVGSRTGDVAALRLNGKSQKMEPVEAGPLIDHVIMTLRAAMAIKCFRDGDVDSGRAQLKTLLEDARRLKVDERLKKIIETESDLIYKPSRLWAVTREDFNKILTEIERTVR